MRAFLIALPLVPMLFLNWPTAHVAQATARRPTRHPLPQLLFFCLLPTASLILPILLFASLSIHLFHALPRL